MFVQNCYINKNTKEIREKLESLGYECGEPLGIINSYKFIFTQNGKYWGSHNGFVNHSQNRGTDVIPYGVICTDNEPLFFAIASLRDDTDKDQWFVSNVGEWFLNRYDKFRKDITDWTCGMDSSEWHKASINELINNFNGVTINDNKEQEKVYIVFHTIQGIEYDVYANQDCIDVYKDKKLAYDRLNELVKGMDKECKIVHQKEDYVYAQSDNDDYIWFEAYIIEKTI